MAKYSFEFKKKIVLEYLNGEGGVPYLAKKYGIPAKSSVEKWIKNYKAFGDKGLMRSYKQKNYTLEEKLFVVELYLTNEMFYQELALQEVTKNGIKYTERAFSTGNWEFKFSKPRNEGLLPVLMHTQFNGWH